MYFDNEVIKVLVWFMVSNVTSTIVQLYSGGQFYWWRKPEYPEKTTDLPQVNDTQCIILATKVNSLNIHN